MSLYTGIEDQSGSQAQAARMNREHEITIGGNASRGRQQHDDRLDNLNVDRAAYLLGASSVEQVEALARKIDRAYVRSAMLHTGAMTEALSIRSIDRETGGEGPATLEERVRPILERAASNRQAVEHAERYRAERDIAQTCPVFGRPDPTTRPRMVPWLTDGPRPFSDDGYRAVMGAWFADADPADIERARQWLIDQGTLDPQPRGKKR